MERRLYKSRQGLPTGPVGNALRNSPFKTLTLFVKATSQRCTVNFRSKQFNSYRYCINIKVSFYTTIHKYVFISYLLLENCKSATIIKANLYGLTFFNRSFQQFFRKKIFDVLLNGSAKWSCTVFRIESFSCDFFNRFIRH